MYWTVGPIFVLSDGWIWRLWLQAHTTAVQDHLQQNSRAVPDGTNLGWWYWRTRIVGEDLIEKESIGIDRNLGSASSSATFVDCTTRGERGPGCDSGLNWMRGLTGAGAVGEQRRCTCACRD